MIDPILHTLRQKADRLKVAVYLVGGPVRDTLLDRSCHDWDFVSHKADVLSRHVAQALRAKRITLDDQNKIYRVIVLRTPQLTLDFAEMQGKTIESDLARRDFTINAMAQPVGESRIIDLYGGRKDLQKKIVRAVSRQAFKEDPIRLLRTFRFSAQFGFTIDPKTLAWVKADHELLASRQGGVARERVREELLKMFAQPSSGKQLWVMDKVGLLTTLLPDMEAGRRVGLRYYGKGGVIKHALQSVDNLEWILQQVPKGSLRYAGDPRVSQGIHAYLKASIAGHPRPAYLKLGTLLHDIGKPATAQVIKRRLRFFQHDEVGGRMADKLLETLRFSRQEVRMVQMWVRHHMRPGNLAATSQMTPKAMARFFRDLGEDGVGMLLVSLGDHYTYLSRKHWGKGTDSVEVAAKRLLESYYIQREKMLPPRIINGHQLMKALKLSPGPEIGKLLEAIQDAQAGGKVKTPADAIAFAKRWKG